MAEDNQDIPLNIKIGQEQELFFFNEFSPGSAFWLPNGVRVYNKLQTFIRDEYYKRGFQEVKTPIIAKEELWEISGHLSKYKDSMFCIEDGEGEDKEVYYMKPMQCPLHCMMYKHQHISYKQLPLRLADFGDLHRNELRGSLRSLFRNKKFAQDDAHVFCTAAQIKGEIKSCLAFLTDVYGIFGFQFEVALSTRPDKYIGDIKVWDDAEKQLADVLNESGFKWTVKEKDGAFYGNKIDIQLTDSLGRKHQCATIQLDFNLPECFKLEYIDDKGVPQRPVMIHRAIYGSFERFIAVLLEHTNGKLPFWLNYHQVVVIPITNAFDNYAHFVKQKLMEYKYYVDVDDSDLQLNKKISNAQLKHYNYILVVGKNEVNDNTVSIRYRDNNTKKTVKIDELLEELAQNVKEFK